MWNQGASATIRIKTRAGLRDGMLYLQVFGIRYSDVYLRIDVIVSRGLENRVPCYLSTDSADQ